ncbi:hypothetical protein GIB67_037776 [Kingdonia uniflora]|uniref:Uncharacterized protein n=1 Tax=Kingdonia uniflora TaxID=39325 RepID=A0A7J7LUZ2_9MAGN|nr:hypothetical protein GIB67_037776 [Kingdonia uniflora]
MKKAIFLISFFIFLGAFGTIAKARTLTGFDISCENGRIIVRNYEGVAYPSPPPPPTGSTPQPNLSNPPVKPNSPSDPYSSFI